MGGMTWVSLTGKEHATLSFMQPSTGILGWGPTRRPGGFGELRLDFNNSSIISTTTNISIRGLTTYTIAQWCFPTDFSQAGTLYSEQTAVAQDVSRIAVRVGLSTGRVDVAGRGADTDALLTFIASSGSTALTLNAWKHVVFVFDSVADSHFLYFNGVQVRNTAQAVATVSNTTPARGSTFGGTSDATPANFFTGSVDDLRIYNYGLSATMVTELYYASTMRYRRELNWMSYPLFDSAAAFGLDEDGVWYVPRYA